MNAVMALWIGNDSGASACRPWNAFDRFSTARIMSAGAVVAGSSWRLARHPDEAAGLARGPSASERAGHRIASSSTSLLDQYGMYHWRANPINSQTPTPPANLPEITR